MPLSRRSFMASSMAGVAGAMASRVSFAGAGFQQSPPLLPDEDGYKLWLRYAPPGEAANSYRSQIRQLVAPSTSPTGEVIRNELGGALKSLLGATVPTESGSIQNGALIVGTPKNAPAISDLNWNDSLAKLGSDGFIIRTTRVGDRAATVVASSGELGAMYGAFHLLGLMQAGKPIDKLDIAQQPRLKLRMVNHWDNINGTIERGYAGRSLWQWDELPGTISPRYADYARAHASVGINAAAINNVNANVRFLSPEYLAKIAALASVWRPYGIRLYLSANFAAPRSLGGLTTADPLDKDVIAWWKAKADEIYSLIPDFGGFLVKANSEGQPGPKDYGRNHAEGSSVLADAVAPHGGNVIWRAFIYDEDVDPDRTKRAHIEFTKLDGKFRPNVIVQIKNGPLDFQPREPFHPLFGAMKETPVVAEIQPTQEYLGQAKHLVYLGTQWKEFLDSDTFANGPGTTVGKVLEGQRISGMVGVLNPGLDTNWCGHHFCQANWYAMGRLAWDHTLSAEGIADDWIRMTFTNDPAIVKTIRDMMMSSHETFVNYTMPLGLHHLIGGNHYAPMPQTARALCADWTATYYHQASTDGIGFDRTTSGSNAVSQYYPPLRETLNDIKTCPEKFLLWFHRCPWDYKMKSGKTLWQEMCAHYFRGAAEAAALEATWASLAGKIDVARHKHVADRMSAQTTDSARWRDQVLAYFAQFSRLPIEGGAG